MVSRLILEWDLPQRLLEEYIRQSDAEFRILVSDRERAEVLRESGLPVNHGETSDERVLRGVGSPDVIVVGSRQTEQNFDIARTARLVYPQSSIVALRTIESTAAEREQLQGVVDTILDASTALKDRVISLTNTPAALRSRRVGTILREADDDLAIFTHDNPDPDAIGSAFALEALAERFNVSAQTYYYGTITHQSNRAFVNILELDPIELSVEDEPPLDGLVALVDHSIPGINDSLPPETDVDVIFDHHSPGGPVAARYVDLRESVGATCTILSEYLRQFDIEPSHVLASALLYGIKTDTRDFTRKVSTVDLESAAWLWDAADHATLQQVANPSVGTKTIGTIADAIEHRRVEGPILLACVGSIDERDALGQAADLLIQMDGISVTLIYGIMDGEIVASARAQRHDVPFDLSVIMREAFSAIGSAGGHEEMAGARIPLGILADGDSEAEDDLVAVVREVIDNRFLESIQQSWITDRGQNGE